jgi:hypothetical protein
MYATALNRLTRMQRPSSNGYEITVTPLYRTPSDWSYVALLYPTDPHDTRPSEVLEDYRGMKWDAIADKVSALLSGHVNTGFYFL